MCGEWTSYAPSGGVKWPYIPWQIFIHAAETWAKANLIFTKCKVSDWGINADVWRSPILGTASGLYLPPGDKLPGCVGTAGQISMAVSRLVKEEKRSWVNLWVSTWGAAGQKEIFPDKILIPVFTKTNKCFSLQWRTIFTATTFLEHLLLIGSLSVTPQTHPCLIIPDSFQTDQQQDEEAACTMLPPGWLISDDKSLLLSVLPCWAVV